MIQTFSYFIAVINLSTFYTYPGEKVDWTKHFHPTEKGAKKGQDDEDYRPSSSNEEEQNKDVSGDSLDDFRDPASMKKKKVGISRRATRKHVAKERDRAALLSGSPPTSDEARRAMKEAKEKLGVRKSVKKVYTPKFYWQWLSKIGKETPLDDIPTPVPQEAYWRIKKWPEFDSKCADKCFYFNCSDVFTPSGYREWFFLPPDGEKNKAPVKVYHSWLTGSEGAEKRKRDPFVTYLKFPILYYDPKMKRQLSEEDVQRCVRARSHRRSEKEEGLIDPHTVQVHSFLYPDGQLYPEILVTSYGRDLPEYQMSKFLKSQKTGVIKQRILDNLQRGDTKQQYARLCAAAADPSEMPLSRSQVNRMGRQVRKELHEGGKKLGHHGNPAGKLVGNEAEATSETLRWLLETTTFSSFVQNFSRERLNFDDPATDYWIVGNKGCFEMMNGLAQTDGLEVRKHNYLNFS